MSQVRRFVTLSLAALAAASSALLPVAAAAAPRPDASPPGRAVALPSKGDADGDRIADDLEGVLAGIGPASGWR